MVPIIDVPHMQAWLRRRGVATVIEELAATIREDFLRWPQFDKTARVASHSPEGVIELMPTADGVRYGFKFVNGHPGNGRAGKLTVTAFGVLADVATGYPVLLAEMTLATALRTAATSALAARALSRPGARTMALIGNGAQSEFQTLAFHRLVGIRQIRAFDVDPSATARLRRNLADVPGLDIVAAGSVDEAVDGADIVTTATADKRRAQIVQDGHIRPGMHVNAIGGDCPGKTELAAAVLRRARVFVEYAPQTRVEGDIQQLGADFPVTELWEVLSDPARGRSTDDEVTVFDSVGFALEDFATLRYLQRQVERSGLGFGVRLIPELDDPRNLYSLVAPGAAEAARRAA
ncbi:ornithine cyclodeaminase [Nitrogeniibacter mangrovi]|uniref:Ornithine cyclodeaminase n=1 Tax=Nitrogeniibacter mangrovi TaxID=2016596 RepID=A0A6C1AZA5_9RHOO|nr:ornithine cyclodeaminase [Nitrogeniibacter mangrovi]QID16701.1 ornithine cyclodeaminase [Nitrogeniibacter mangrovi]